MVKLKKNMWGHGVTQEDIQILRVRKGKSGTETGPKETGKKDREREEADWDCTSRTDWGKTRGGSHAEHYGVCILGVCSPWL